MIQRIQSSEKEREFNIALCERLGLSAEAVSESGFSWSVSSDGDPARINLTAIMPHGEFLALAREHGMLA